jgi:hypothetical protein
MSTPWIRVRDLGEYYSMSRAHAYELAARFRAMADADDVIKDGRIVLIRKEAFEEFLRGRSK